MSKLSLSLVAFAVTLLAPLAAFAQGMPGAGKLAAEANKFDASTGLAIAAGIAIGLGALGGTLGQGRAAAAALEGISRNPNAAPRIQTPLILGLALIESLVLIAFVIAFMLLSKIPTLT